MRTLPALAFWLVAAFAGALRAADLKSLRLNELQFLGSHNSYRLATHRPILTFLSRLSSVLPDALNPGGWDYTHEPLDVQLSQYGVRSVELDIFLDPAGGLYAKRQGNRLAGESVESREAALKEPGMKVLHFPDLDYRTNYLTRLRGRICAQITRPPTSGEVLNETSSYRETVTSIICGPATFPSTTR